MIMSYILIFQQSSWWPSWLRRETVMDNCNLEIGCSTHPQENIFAIYFFNIISQLETMMADEKKRIKNFLYMNYRYHERKPWLSISKSHFIKTTSIKHSFVIFIFYSLYIIVTTHLLNVLKSMSCLQVVLFYNFIYNDLIYGPWIDYLYI